MDEPILTIDLSVIGERYRTLHKLLPEVEIAYAVKANPHPSVLSYLAGLGASFDVASKAELDAVLKTGVSLNRVEYSHPVKPFAHLTHAFSKGVTRFTADGSEEIQKLAATCPGAKILFRMDVDHEGASWPLSDKFGVSDQEVIPLAQEALAAGLHPVGVAFHVGSMQMSPDAFEKALRKAGVVYKEALSMGIAFTEVNIGGGFPSYCGTWSPPPLSEYAASIKEGLESFPKTVQITCEPGRYLVADAGTLTTEVLGTAMRNGIKWVYLNAGYYHGLGETDLIPTRFETLKPQDSELVPTILAGPTCDSVDVLYRRTPVLLPEDIQTGDKILFHSTGVYCTNVSTTFNGFPPPHTNITMGKSEKGTRE